MNDMDFLDLFRQKLKENYDDYDPEFIKMMEEDWDNVLQKLMEDKQDGKET